VDADRGAGPYAAADVTVTTDTAAWTRFLMTPLGERPDRPPGVVLAGAPREVALFLDRLALLSDWLPTARPSARAR
jgi:hypothetical protein